MINTAFLNVTILQTIRNLLTFLTFEFPYEVCPTAIYNTDLNIPFFALFLIELIGQMRENVIF